MAAPRPLGLTGANDWTVEIESKGLPELTALYSLLGVHDLVEAHCYPRFEHNYNSVSRAHMYTWMNRHLGLGIQEPMDEPALVPVEPSRLKVFDDEHPRPADTSDLAGVRATLREFADRELERLEGLATTDSAEFRRVVGGALRAITHAQLPVMGGTERVAENAKLSGTDADLATLRRMSIEKGEEAPLAMDGHTIHYDLAAEQGRIVDRTFYIVNPGEKLSVPTCVHSVAPRS